MTGLNNIHLNHKWFMEIKNPQAITVSVDKVSYNFETDYSQKNCNGFTFTGFFSDNVIFKLLKCSCKINSIQSKFE